MSKKQRKGELLYVGLGASAGGLEALKTFFSLVPESSGMAFIVIIHLSPEHKSSLAELLQKKTKLKVIQVNESVDIEEDHVYVIPPQKMLSVEDGHLELSDRNKGKAVAIDLFFRSLGKTKGEKSVSVILSGSGSDGSVGMKTVKENGGMTIVQDPQEATYDGMPRNAISTGLTDKVLPVSEMMKELRNYKDNLYKIDIAGDDEELKDGDADINKILSKVRTEAKHDFSQYKRASVLRRIKRRMQVTQINTLQEYFDYLDEKPEEINELFKDLLISVTDFFRDEESFKELRKKIIPKLFQDKQPDDQLRVWVPGCATGEEAYSVAMLLQDFAQNVDNPPEIQIFATDIDKNALNVARKGTYPDSIISDIPSDFLDRYFVKGNAEYRVKEELSSMILFANHDLLKDPPFSNLDMISCRNLLIYLNKDLQSETFELFHYALRSNGWLFLGQSDSHQKASNLFTMYDKQYKIYQQIPTSKNDFQFPNFSRRLEKSIAPSPQSAGLPQDFKSGIEELHQKVMSEFIPPSVIISENYDVVHSTEGIDRYLQYSGGEPSRNILDMVISDLRQPLRSLLFLAGKEDASFPIRKNVRFHSGDETSDLEIIVQKVKESDFSEGLKNVVFKEKESSDRTALENRAAPEGASEDEEEIIEALEQELKDTKEQLQIMVENYETTNEELRASNEELQSMNEELQSTTEELETSKEELQSVNEELITVNEELESKIEKLREINNDLKNLMDAPEIGTLFIDTEYRIKRYTSRTTEIFNLIPSDEGRPLQHVTHNLNYDSLLNDIEGVFENLGTVKKLVSSKDDRWYNMRLRPYRTIEDQVDGVVITFVDVTDLKNTQAALEQQAAQQHTLAELGLFILDTKNLNRIEDRIIEEVCKVENIEHCLLLDFEAEEKLFTLKTSVGCSAERGTELKVNDEEEWEVMHALEADDPLIVEDYSEEEFINIPLLDDVTSGAIIKIEGAEEVHGVMCIYSQKKRQFVKSEIDFMQITANIIGGAIERQQAEDEIRASNQRLRNSIKENKELQREVLKADVKERWKIGEYLHDDLAQILVGVELMVGNLKKKLKKKGAEVSEEIAKIKEALRQANKSARELSHEIIPVDVEKEGIKYAFDKLKNRMQDLYQLNCKMEGQDILDEIDDIEVSNNLYRVAQESAINAAVHGNAENVKITFKSDENNLYLQIEDDGEGFKDGDEENGDGMGLKIMKYHMEVLGGTFEVEESADSEMPGVRIKCSVPWGKTNSG